MRKTEVKWHYVLYYPLGKSEENKVSLHIKGEEADPGTQGLSVFLFNQLEPTRSFW
jgi:hypothetical protein